jgi:Zn-dependent oligopeptidase
MSRDLPDYAHATPEDLAQACRAAIEECDARIVALVAIPAGQRTFGNTVLAVEEAHAVAKEARLAWACWRTPLPTKT